MGPSQVACADLVRVSAAAREDACQCEAVSQAASFREKDAEQSAHKMFIRFGLSLRVPISWLQLKIRNEHVRVPYLKVSDYLRKLIETYPDTVFANSQHPGQRCQSFWKAYYWTHPSHDVYKKFNVNDLTSVIPIALHGDEGTGSKKQPVSIVNWQTLWGNPTLKTEHLQEQVFGGCTSCNASSKITKICKVPEHWPVAGNGDMRLSFTDLVELQHQYPTTSGHSFLSRHLVCCLPTHVVKKGPEVLDAILDATAKDISMLFEAGIETTAGRFFVALVACKGDAKWHAATARLLRCYSRIGEVNQNPICAECLGGHPSYPFEDTSSNPKWVQTLFTSVPWDEEGKLEQIPYDPAMPAHKYKRDLLHVFKIGLARDICGSCIMLLTRRLKRFDGPTDSTELGQRLKRAHGRFSLWAAASQKSPHLRGFTKDSLHLTRVDGYAYTNTKGSDSMLLLAWLRMELQLIVDLSNPENHEDMGLITAARDMCTASIDMFTLLYSHGLFLPSACFQQLRDYVVVITRGYNYLALQSLRRGFPGFSLKSTIHGMHHFAVELDIYMQSNAPCCPSPLLAECSQCEDFIGRTARVARATHSRTTALKCLQRHLVKSKLLLKRAHPKRKKCS